MRRFSSYGPVSTKVHYYAPREELIDSAYAELTGDDPQEGGHYITVWAPRQTGKTWIMQQVMKRIREQGDFETGIISMQSAKEEDTGEGVLEVFVSKLEEWFERDLPDIRSWEKLSRLFKKEYFAKPLILIVDEFDALGEEFINKFANVFRDIYIGRRNQSDRPTDQKSCLLHGLALIDVRSMLGIRNVTGPPSNIQRGLHIPNLTREETEGMFEWYEKESGQRTDRDVTERIFRETRGHPGLVCWFGELLTEKYNKKFPEPISMRNFEIVSAAAVNALPDDNILNIISKANTEPYRSVVLDLFRTGGNREFFYDDSLLNYLYMNGVISCETENEADYFVRFACPFVQKRLFSYFARELFGYVGEVREPFEDMSDTLTQEELNIGNLMRRFQSHLRKNRKWLLADAPRRKDLRIFEAVYHFGLYRFLCDFLGTEYARVWPEFPTGNGEVDIVIEYAGRRYALELKSYAHERGYKKALGQAAEYGKQLGLSEVSLVFFVEYVDDASREKYEKTYTDEETGVRVMPVFVDVGE
ncbi:AAA-like domain-containing protein [Desulfobacterales bacterium HSG2]|nr:AAA-like domain-containing protein [Desulfobacterales bacterium HSG2]